MKPGNVSNGVIVTNGTEEVLVYPVPLHYIPNLHLVAIVAPAGWVEQIHAALHSAYLQSSDKPYTFDKVAQHSKGVGIWVVKLAAAGNFEYLVEVVRMQMEGVVLNLVQAEPSAS